MAAIVKQTTVFIVVVLSVTHRLAEAGHVGHDRESAKIARYDQEKFGEHLDKDEGRDLSAKTRREVDTPVEKQPHFADFKRKTVNSMLWQTSRTQLEKEGLSLGTRLSTTGHLLNPESSGPHHIRTERDTTFLETQQKIRPKREVIIHPQLKPEVVMQVRIEMPMQKDTEEKYQEKLAQEKIPYLIDSRGNPLLFRPARTTPNPFIRQTNIEDYEIVKPNLGDQFRPISDADASDMESSYELSECQNVLNEISKKLLSLKGQVLETEQGRVSSSSSPRIKRSPKMSKLKKKQKLMKKKRKKKKQQKLTPRQIKHYRRIREHKEERRKILHKRLKEKRRLRHKKLGTGPYNKTIIDYYGVYFDPPSSQINESLYDTIYDSSAIDSEKMYEEGMENYPDSGVEYEDSEEDDGEEGENGDKEEDERDGEEDGIKAEIKQETQNKNKLSKRKSKMNQLTTEDKNNQIQSVF